LRRCGCSLPRGQAARLAIDIVGKVDGDPPALRVDLDLDLDGNAVRDAGEGIVPGIDNRPAGGEPADRIDHLLLGIVEPKLRVSLQRIPADLAAQRQELARADSDGPERRQIVPPPLLGNADARLAHADQVLTILVVGLDFGGGEDQGPFFIDVDGVAHIGRRP
jgi:hypothetical protein